MANFTRGISDKSFIAVLNHEKCNPVSYWSKILSDKELFVAIRKNLLNVYYFGQSLVELQFKNIRDGLGVTYGKIHKKYIGIDEESYAKVIDGVIVDSQSKIQTLSDLDSIKKNMSHYIKKEKRSSYSEVINHLDGVIDVEIAFSKVKDMVLEVKKKSDYEVSSIDYATIDKIGNLVFYEAKHFTNKELRSKTEPEVIKQIERYEKALKEHSEEIITSYMCVIKNRIELGLPNSNILNAIFDKKIELKLNTKPRLIVFDTKDRQWTGIEKIKNKIGDRLTIYK